MKQGYKVGKAEKLERMYAMKWIGICAWSWSRGRWRRWIMKFEKGELHRITDAPIRQRLNKVWYRARAKRSERDEGRGSYRAL